VLLRFLILGCIGAAAFGASPTNVFPYSYSQQDLPNGLRLVVVPTDSSSIVATYIVVQAGSRNEVEPGHTGFAHLFEHLMFKGTDAWPEAKYTDALERMGAISNAYTADDYTCFYTVFSKEGLPAVLAMEADRFQHLKFSEGDFKTETRAVLGEYNKDAASPFSQLEETLDTTAFVRSPYQHPTMGFLKDVQDMPAQYAYSLKFFDRYYRPEYTTILVVGNVKPREVREMVDRSWGNWQRGVFRPEIPQEPAQEGPRVARVDWPGPTLPIVEIAYKGPAYTDSAKDTAALEALAYLAFSPTSDLYQKLVVTDRTAASLSAEAPGEVDPALFEITARVNRAGNADSVRDQIYAAVRSFQDKPVDPGSLDAVRRHLRNALALRMQSSDAIAGTLARYIALRRTPETLNLLYQQFAALTPQDIQQAAEKYLTENRRTTVTLAPSSPQTAAAEVAK
jgi:zinc protease